MLGLVIVRRSTTNLWLQSDVLFGGRKHPSGWAGPCSFQVGHVSIPL